MVNDIEHVLRGLKSQSANHDRSSCLVKCSGHTDEPRLLGEQVAVPDGPLVNKQDVEELQGTKTKSSLVRSASLERELELKLGPSASRGQSQQLRVNGCPSLMLNPVVDATSQLFTKRSQAW